MYFLCAVSPHTFRLLLHVCFFRQLSSKHLHVGAGNGVISLVLTHFYHYYLYPTFPLYHVPYSTYYKPMMYYKPTHLFRSKFLYRYRTLIYGNSHYKSIMYYKPTPLFRADVREIAHGLIIRTIRYIPSVKHTYFLCEHFEPVILVIFNCYRQPSALVWQD